MDVLTGYTAGDSRADLIDKAVSIAVGYFGIECVQVRLRDERMVQEIRTINGKTIAFEAEFLAQEHHNIEGKSYGPGACRDCKRDSWPHSPLRTADWSGVC